MGIDRKGIGKFILRLWFLYLKKWKGGKGREEERRVVEGGEGKGREEGVEGGGELIYDDCICICC